MSFAEEMIFSLARPHPDDVLPALAPEVEPANLDALQQRLLSRLTQALDLARVRELPEDRREEEVRGVIEHLIEAEPQSVAESSRKYLIRSLLAELMGLGPLGPLLRDPTVSEIMVNGPRQVFIERNGRLEEVPARFRDADHILQIIERIASRIGRRIDETTPMVDARLPDGSRVNSIIPPVALCGPTLTIRRFGNSPLKVEDL